MTENGSSRRAGTARRYSPWDSYVVMFRLVLDRGYSEPQRGQTEEYWSLVCPGCGHESLRVYKDSGRISCTNEDCEEVTTKSEPLFAVVADLCEYDRQEEKGKIRERIQHELDEDERIGREKEKKERRELKGKVSSQEAELEEAWGKVEQLQNQFQDYQSRADKIINGLDKENRELRSREESRDSREIKIASLLIAAATFVGMLFWVWAVQRMSAVETTVMVNLVLSAAMAGLLTTVFYQEVGREREQNSLAKPFYQRIKLETLAGWGLKSVASFVAPLAVVYWILATPRLSEALPVGSFGWEASVTAAAVVVVICYLLWASRTPLAEQRRS